MTEKEREQAERQYQIAGEKLKQMLSGECKNNCKSYESDGDIACVGCFDYSHFW